MTVIDCNTCATDLTDTMANSQLRDRGYTVRHIETWHRDGNSVSFIVWDSPDITEADLPF